MTGIETENRYKVFPANQHGDKMSDFPIFKSKEKSSWCQRQCCSGKRRAFEMFISSSIPRSVADLQFFDKDVFIVLRREYSCTVCCFGRPKIDVYIVNNFQE